MIDLRLWKIYMQKNLLADFNDCMTFYENESCILYSYEKPGAIHNPDMFTNKKEIRKFRIFGVANSDLLILETGTKKYSTEKILQK